MIDKSFLVSYSNDINKMSLGEFSEKEIDVFFTLILKSKKIENNIINITFQEISEIANIEKRSTTILKNILGLNRKLKRLEGLAEISPNRYVNFSLFGDILTDTEQKTVEVNINPRFKHLLDDLLGNFTIFDLKDLVSLKGHYPKTLFRLLKQWETTKKYHVSMEAFRQIMSIPESYKQTHIDQTVLHPAMKELEKFFPKLKLQKLKKGVKIDSLVFTWIDKVNKEKKSENIGIVERSQGLTVEDYNQLEAEKVEKIIEKVEVINFEKLSEDEEKRALDLLGNE
ncbi:MAG: replication initiation protein, partial [Cetobacterium sp.]